MTVRIYVRASTKDQDAKRALSDLIALAKAIMITMLSMLSISVVQSSIGQY